MCYALAIIHLFLGYPLALSHELVGSNSLLSKSIIILTLDCKNIIGRAKRVPHRGVQSRFCVIHMYMSVCMSVVGQMRRRNYVAQTRACSKSVLGS